MSLIPRIRALREALQRAASLRAATTATESAAAARAPFASSSAAAAAPIGGGDDPLAAAAPPPHQAPAMEVFDRPRKWAQRDRAAAMRWTDQGTENGGPQEDADPLVAAVAARLVDRLEDCVAKFPTAVILPGAGADAVSARLRAGGRAGVERVVRVEASPGALALARALHERRVARDGAGAWPRTHFVLADEEFLPLAPGSVDLVVSCLGLHWANDLPGALSQARLALRSDGLLLAALFGGESLRELRRACALAQLEREGGVAPVVSPLARVRDGGNVLTRAGLALPTVDVDAFRLRYPDARRLAAHIRAMGEGSAPAAAASPSSPSPSSSSSSAVAVHPRRSLRRDAALAAAAVHAYLTATEEAEEEEQGQGGAAGGGGGTAVGGGGGAREPSAEVAATFEVMFLTGWSPSRSQPRAAKRGSATISFEEFARHVEEQEKKDKDKGGGGAGDAAAAGA